MGYGELMVKTFLLNTISVTPPIKRMRREAGNGVYPDIGPEISPGGLLCLDNCLKKAQSTGAVVFIGGVEHQPAHRLHVIGHRDLQAPQTFLR